MKIHFFIRKNLASALELTKEPAENVDLNKNREIKS